MRAAQVARAGLVRHAAIGVQVLFLEFPFSLQKKPETECWEKDIKIAHPSKIVLSIFSTDEFACR